MQGSSSLQFAGANGKGYGTLNVTGVGGTSSKGGNGGGVVFHLNNADYNVVEANNININGKGLGGSNAPGVYLADVSIEGAHTAITGVGGSGTGVSNYGIELAGSVDLVDQGSLKLTGTGTGNAADILATSSGSYATNYLFVDNGSSFSINGTRDKLDLKYLDILLTQ
jgi:hypothetical protein